MATAGMVQELFVILENLTQNVNLIGTICLM